MEEVNTKKKQKLDNLYNKYKPHEKFLIAKQARKTIRYIERNTTSFPNTYKVLKNKLLIVAIQYLKIYIELIYLKKIEHKKEVVVNIQILNFYLEEALRKDLIRKKHLIFLEIGIFIWYNFVYQRGILWNIILLIIVN